MTREDNVLVRRQLLRGVTGGAVIALAGCTGGGSDTDADSTDTGDDSADPSQDDAVAGDAESAFADDGQVTVAEDFESVTSETWIRQEYPDGEVLTIESYTEWDLANDRAYRRVETSMADGGNDDIPVIEYYVVSGTTYQVIPSGCSSFDGTVIDRDHIADIQIPDGRDIETADNVEQEPRTDLDGQSVDVWRYDLGETIALQEGEMTVYIDPDTGYVVGIDGWYEVGHVDNPTTISFEQRNDGFDESYEIEPPAECD